MRINFDQFKDVAFILQWIERPKMLLVYRWVKINGNRKLTEKKIWNIVTVFLFVKMGSNM